MAARGKHQKRRHKGQANRDPARKTGMPPGGYARHPKGSKMGRGIVGPRGGQRK